MITTINEFKKQKTITENRRRFQMQATPEQEYGDAIKKKFELRPAYPVPPFKRDFTKEESKALHVFFPLHSWSNIDADGRIVLGGGEEARGWYYITEEDLAKLVQKMKTDESFSVTESVTDMSKEITQIIYDTLMKNGHTQFDTELVSNQEVGEDGIRFEYDGHLYLITVDELDEMDESLRINEDYIRKKGIERVRRMLHKAVDQYVNSLNDMSEDASDEFFIKDFANEATK